MAGTAEIEETIANALLVLSVAQKVGAGSWNYVGNTLTISNKELADAVRKVLDGVDAIELTKEAKDLSPFEVIGLARHSLGALQKVLGR